MAGGFSESDLTSTVRAFVSQNCLGSINRELPGQFEGMTIQSVIDHAKNGDKAAGKCIKLLNQDRIRK